MQQDEISQSIISYLQQHNRPDLALMPDQISQGVLDILIEDTRHMAEAALESRPRAGRYITLAVLLLHSKLKGQSSIQMTESELQKSISRYTQAIYLENLSRQGIIKNLRPAVSQDNVFDPNIRPEYDLTELGKQVAKESLQPLPDYQST
ncbi:hypothetical protein [Pseudobacteriovorax antillogorgiicola]|uniref:Uncharacterized protein n=1 Tax=Pseudobacteriovorax antillogorgiicola TaxID=1513793 RepID=A0A1Y6BYQ9_9BACT|nr:hypothetical protein [Pseudobacteriovorax antillogorgiicola]TCS51273.1 hypothetical protein EDD56_111158 [Pseudobacteriovorax antillogorgiicola]SMF36342.1 hypothetical protein SAMN06296036_11120 [Pseudobacteriovorax antillogorgiicola]